MEFLHDTLTKGIAVASEAFENEAFKTLRMLAENQQHSLMTIPVICVTGNREINLADLYVKPADRTIMQVWLIPGGYNVSEGVRTPLLLTETGEVAALFNFTLPQKGLFRSEKEVWVSTYAVFTLEGDQEVEAIKQLIALQKLLS